MASQPKQPLWLKIENEIQGFSADDLSPGNLEQTIQRAAQSLDGSGINVSQNAGNMLELRWAVDSRTKVGRPLLDDFNSAVGALELEDVNDTYAAAVKIINSVGEAWPKIKDSARKTDIINIVEKKRFDLVVARAQELGGEPGIRFLIQEHIAAKAITEAMGVSEEEYARVNAAVEAEQAERTRVIALVEEAADKTDEEKVKHLLSNDAADDLILELASVDQGTLDTVKKAMEAELAEQKRLAEEEEARKKAEAEGPPIDQIPPDELLEFIESVREIMEFSDQEAEIRTMCEQSSIPKSLIDIAVSDPDKLDELESKAEAG
jgi:hypothetical protein